MPGAIDANGVYQYTESDLSFPFSTMLNLGQASISAAFGGAWTAYTPTLTASTSPTNYTGTGRYKKVGRILVMNFQFTAGASFTAGSGTYGVSTPVPVVVSAITQGSARLYDSSTGNAILGARVATFNSSSIVFQTTTTYAGTLTNVGNAVPWTWATGDIIDGFAILESAS